MEFGINAEIKPVLLVSASDSSAAAGMQVDLRVLDDLGAPARCAVTAITIQGDKGARRIHPVSPDLLVAAVETALSDAPGVGAVKVGLLGDISTAQALAKPLSGIYRAGVPIVVDPVMRSTPGSALSLENTAEAIVEEVLPWTALVTPNRDELRVLGAAVRGKDDDELSTAERLMGSGVGAVLVTGGDTAEDHCLDILYEGEGRYTEFHHPRIGTGTPRGTGCALSTAIAVHLARGISLGESVNRSIDYVTGLIEQSALVGNQLLLFPGKKQGKGVRK